MISGHAFSSGFPITNVGNDRAWRRMIFGHVFSSPAGALIIPFWQDDLREILDGQFMEVRKTFDSGEPLVEIC